MRQLHVLGVSDDGQALLLGPSAGKASHRLRLDDKLRAAVRGQLSAVGVDRAESALTPKEIQARMREGATPEEVAKEAQVPVARVLPYAAPVIAERERIVEQARAALLHRSRGPNGQRPLGEVVDAHLAETAGIKTETVEWSARRRRDGAWVVLLSYVARGGRRAASWLWRPVERDLTALDSSATRLASEESSTPRRKSATAAKKATRRPTAKKTAKRTTKKVARKAAKKSATSARPVRQGAAKARTRKAAATPPAKKAAARKSTARKQAVRPSTARKQTAPKPVTKTTTKSVARSATRAAPVTKVVTAKPAVTKKSVRKATPKPAAATRRTRREVEPEATPIRPTVVPDPVVLEAPSPVVVIHSQPEPEPEPQPEAPAAVARRRGERVPLPSWSDVLLGVAPPEGTRETAARRKRKSG